MDDKNYAYLQEKLTIMGFDGIFDNALQTKLKLGVSPFTLKAENTIPEGTVSYTIELGQSKNETQHPKEFYFLNNVSVELTKEGEEKKDHKFLFYKQNGDTHERMANQMAGRSVFESYPKNGRMIEYWKRIDFSAPRDQYENTITRTTFADKFNVERVLNKLPLSKSDPKEKANIIAALKDGEKVMVDVKYGATTERMSLIAMPHLNAIHVFNAQGNRVTFANNQLKVLEGQEKQAVPQNAESLSKATDQKLNEEKQQEQKAGEAKTNTRKQH